MKKHIITILMLLQFLILGYLIFDIYKGLERIGEFGYSIVHKVDVMNLYDGKGSQPVLATYVWHKGDILESWYDPIATLTDSIKNERILWANDLIKKMKAATASIKH